MSQKFKIKVLVGKDTVGFHAFVPALKGLHTYGDTEKEAVENAIKATASYILSLKKYGDPIPLGIRDDEECTLEHGFIFDREYEEILQV